MIRTRRTLAAVGLLSLALLGGCGSSHVAAPSQNVGTRMDGAMPATIEHLRLVDSQGHAHSLAAFRGKVVVLQDTMTLCQETCPIDTATLIQTARAVDAAGEASKVVFLTVTVDPQRDTVAQLAAYHRLYGGPSNWYTLTGSPKQINALWSFLGVYRKKVPQDTPPPRNWRTGKVLTYDIQHSDEAFFFDATGKERFILEGMPDSDGRKGIPAKIYSFLSKEGRDNLKPGKGDWSEQQALDVVGWLLDHKISS